MNIATISPISIQLKLINEYDPILMLLAIKKSLELKVITFRLNIKNELGNTDCQTHRPIGRLAAQQERTNNCDKTTEKD